MKNVSLVVRAVVDGKRVNLSHEHAKAKGLAGTFYVRWSEDGKEKWQVVGMRPVRGFSSSIGIPSTGRKFLPRFGR
jgi:hypothetical protein